MSVRVAQRLQMAVSEFHKFNASSSLGIHVRVEGPKDRRRASAGRGGKGGGQERKDERAGKRRGSEGRGANFLLKRNQQLPRTPSSCREAL